MGLIYTPPLSPQILSWYFIITYTEHDVSLPSGIQMNTEENPRDAIYAIYVHSRTTLYAHLYIFVFIHIYIDIDT